MFLASRHLPLQAFCHFTVAHPARYTSTDVKFCQFMAAAEHYRHCGFDQLLSQNVPHVLEKIFLFLDYESFKICRRVNITWNELLASESIQKKANSVFKIGIDRDIKRLINACWSNKTYEVSDIISTGMISANCEGQDGSTPLCVALCHGSNDVVRLLLQRGADPNKSICGKWMGRKGVTPLISAADNKAGAKLLLDRGGNPNTADESGNTPLHTAALRDNQDMVKLLMDRGAVPNVVGEKGVTPLHLAARNGHSDVVQLLICGGADSNKTDDEGRTPLSEAGYTRLMNILLEAGADAALCCTSGRKDTSGGHSQESV